MFSPTLHIFLLLFSTLLLGSPSEVPRKCSFSVPHYCSCSENEAIRLRAIRMCYYPDDPRAICHPCPIFYQDDLNCTYQENEYPICSFQKFGPEESREFRHPFTTNHTGKRSKFIKFTYGRDVELIPKFSRNHTYDATLNKSHPKSYRSVASLVVNSNENVNYSTLTAESKVGNSELKSISGDKGILPNTRAGQEFGILEQEDIVSKISMDEEGRNPNVNIQLVDIDTMRFLTRKSIRNAPNFIRQTLLHDFLTIKDKTNTNKQAKEPKIYLTFRDLEKSDNIQKLRKLSAEKTYPLYFVAIKPEIQTEENDSNVTGLKKDNHGKKLIILEIRKGKPRFNSKINRNLEKYIQGGKNRKNVVTESSKSSENSLAENTIISAENNGEFKIDNGFLSRNPEDISKSVSNDTSNAKNFQAENSIGAGISLSFKKHWIPGYKEGKLQAATDLIATNTKVDLNAEMNSPTSQDAGVTNGSERTIKGIFKLRMKYPVEKKDTNANINVGRFKDDDEMFLRESSAMNNERNLSPEVPVDIDSRPLQSDADASKISERSSHEDAVVIRSRTDSNASRGSEKSLLEVVGDIISRALQSDSNALRSPKKYLNEDADDIRFRTLAEKFDSPQPDVDASKGSEKSSPEKVVDISPKIFQFDDDVSRSYEKFLAQIFQKNIDTKNSLGKRMLIVINRNAPVGPELDPVFMNNLSKFQEETVERKGTANKDLNVDSISRKYLVGDVDSERNSGKIYEDADDKGNSGIFPDVRNNPEKENNAFLKDSKFFAIITNEPTADKNSPVSYDNVSVSRSGGMDKTHSPLPYEKSDALDKKFINNSNYTITNDPYEVKPNYFYGQTERKPNIWEHYKDTSESQNNILKNEKLFRRKRSFQTTKSKVLTHFSINETNVKSRVKRREPLAQNGWCGVKLMIRSGNLDCTIWSYKKECTLSCQSGYAYQGNKNTKFTCDRKANTWNPSPPMDCTASGNAPPPNPESKEKPKPAHDPEAYADYYADVNSNAIDQPLAGAPELYQDYAGPANGGADDYPESYDYYGEKRRKRRS